MNETNTEIDKDHQTLIEWGVKQMKDICDFMPEDQIRTFFSQNINKNSAELECEMSNLLDITNQKSKTFIAGMIKRKEKIHSIQIKRQKLEQDTKKKNAKKKELKMQELKLSNREM
jgi:hypothetical protein